MIRSLLFALIVLLPSAAQAQLRHIPAEAKRGEMRHLQGMLVEIGGKRMQLAPGAQIRDSDNRIVLPAALREGVLVKYLLDAQENVFRPWILTPEEAAQRDPPAQ